MRPAVFVLTLASLSLAVPALASDDESSESQADIRPFVGAFLPTGKLHETLKSSVLTGVQLGYPIAGPARLVGTFAWAPSRTNGFSDVKTNLYQYDAGAELGTKYGSGWKLSPFVGAGLGARTYSLQHSANSQTDLAGYGAVGTGLSGTRLGARIEARDYVSRFKGLDGLSSTATRNDVMLAGELTFHL